MYVLALVNIPGVRQVSCFRLPLPTNADVRLIRALADAWSAEPSARPTAAEIRDVSDAIGFPEGDYENGIRLIQHIL